MRKIPTFPVTIDQYIHALRLAESSLKSHKTPNVWDNSERKANTLQKRFYGVLGETIFADLYTLPRPARAYGASDGQDYGADFILNGLCIDIKTMRRSHGVLKSHYVFNLEPRQVFSPIKKTDFYIFISIFGDITDGTMQAQICGKIRAADIQNYRTLCTVANAKRDDDTTIELHAPTIALPLSLMQDFKMPKKIPHEIVNIDLA